jgi:hypothetical protein
MACSLSLAPLASSIAGGAGARPDHPIIGLGPPNGKEMQQSAGATTARDCCDTRPGAVGAAYSPDLLPMDVGLQDTDGLKAPSVVLLHSRRQQIDGEAMTAFQSEQVQCTTWVSFHYSQRRLPSE